MRACQPIRDGHVERDGIKIFYELFGTGETTVLLLPTWSIIHSRHWKMQIPYLARHCRIITFDARGNGGSDRPSEAADAAGSHCPNERCTPGRTSSTPTRAGRNTTSTTGPFIRGWTREHYSFAGYVTGFDPSDFADRVRLRHELGYRDDEQICIVTVGGSGVGGHLRRRVIEAFPEGKASSSGAADGGGHGPKDRSRHFPRARRPRGARVHP
jgi:pimeloyl-ACP methyl ester carboxylesterase